MQLESLSPQPIDFTVRKSWYDEVLKLLHRADGGALLVDTRDAQLTLERLGWDAPQPRTHVERLVLRGLLLEVAFRCGHRLHRQNCDPYNRCDFAEGSTLEAFLGDPTNDPKRMFVAWVRRFFVELGRAHPQSPAYKLARQIRTTRGGSLDLPASATALNMTVGQLRRAFCREYGQSIRDYQRCARIVAALEMPPDDNVAEMALHVGYRSKKNFYRAFTRLTGTTPAAFRKLTGPQRHQIVESARLSLAARK